MTWTASVKTLIEKNATEVKEISFTIALRDPSSFERDFYIEQPLFEDSYSVMKDLKKIFKKLFLPVGHDAEFRRDMDYNFVPAAFTMAMLKRELFKMNHAYASGVTFGARDFSETGTSTLIIRSNSFRYANKVTFAKGTYLIFFYKKENAKIEGVYEGYIESFDEHYLVVNTPKGVRRFHRDGLKHAAINHRKLSSETLNTNEEVKSQFVKLTLELAPLDEKKAQVKLIATV